MGFLDALLGRSKPVAPNLDHLFGLPAARITLEASEGLQPTGQAGVCFKPATGQGLNLAEDELRSLLQLDDPIDGESVTNTDLADKADEFGYRWIVLTSTDFDTLVTRVHVVNSTLEDHGYGPQLLCSVFGFVDAKHLGEATTFLVYLFKRGTFYPFVPTGSERRDNEAELRLKAELVNDLAIESDLDRWFPIWSLPVH